MGFAKQTIIGKIFDSFAQIVVDVIWEKHLVCVAKQFFQT